MQDVEKFFSVVNQFDFLKPYFDQENHKIEFEKIAEDFYLLSTGERCFLAFMMTVWEGSTLSGYVFDVVAARKILDDNHWQVVVDWVNDPYWP